MWAFRPKAEDVYEHLEEFFPDHDLDKTFIDPTSDGVSTTAGESPPAAAISKNKYRHRKSLRCVAEERKKLPDRADQSATTKAGNLARKRITKLWGSKIE